MKIEDGLPDNPLDEPREARVARGVALLDERVPDWRTRVDPDTLNMFSDTMCVLGQLFGAYTQGLYRMGITSRMQATRYGFDVVDGAYITINPEESAALTQEWRAQLATTPAL